MSIRPRPPGPAVRSKLPQKGGTASGVSTRGVGRSRPTTSLPWMATRLWSWHTRSAERAGRSSGTGTNSSTRSSRSRSGAGRALRERGAARRAPKRPARRAGVRPRPMPSSGHAPRCGCPGLPGRAKCPRGGRPEAGFGTAASPVGSRQWHDRRTPPPPVQATRCVTRPPGRGSRGAVSRGVTAIHRMARCAGVAARPPAIAARATKPMRREGGPDPRSGSTVPTGKYLSISPQSTDVLPGKV
jgi:hypothetical protein